MTFTIGGPKQVLPTDEVESFVMERMAQIDLDGRSLCLVIPDATRRCPLPLLLNAIQRSVADRVTSCTAVVALGTHAPMDPGELRLLVGGDSLNVINHAWWEENTCTHVGSLSSSTVSQLSGHRLDESVDVRINRIVLESDVTIIVGPVLPHEVVGFSGGNKYLFPGLSGQELIDITHWLGALISSREIIGTRGITPVRALIDAAAALVPGERHALCVVVDHDSGDLHSMAFGDPAEAWSTSAEVAAETHIEYLSTPVDRVLSVISPRYDDLWTGAKGFYKVEPVVADGGEVVVYAPHITEIAAMHPEIEGLAYHCRDYFLANRERSRTFPRGVLAHSTHLFGAGTYNATDGERQRVRVTLATGIPEDVVRRVNLRYADPRTIDPAGWATDADALVVPDAGEVLYRLRD